MEHQIKCTMCENTADKNIKLSLPSGIRGCGVSHTVYYCSHKCLDEFKKTRQCQNCRCTSYEMEMIDGYSVCTDDSQWMNKPTCKHKYAGIFQCDFCNKEKTGTSYLLNACDEIYELDGNAELLMCEDCFRPYEKHNSQFNCEKYRSLNIFWLRDTHPCYQLILLQYKCKFELPDFINVIDFKKVINKLYETNKIDELREIHNLIRDLLNLDD